MKALNSRLDSQNQPKPKKQEEDNEDLSNMILIDPAKAVQKITAKVKEEVMGTVASDTQAREVFNGKFLELQNDFPEIANQDSKLHKKAKELLAASGASKFDGAALERAVLKAAAEEGMVAMKYRKQQQSDDDEYLGGGSNSPGPSSRQRSKNEKLPAATVAFAELVGVNLKDPKVLERVTSTYNTRKGNWNKYK